MNDALFSQEFIKYIQLEDARFYGILVTLVVTFVAILILARQKFWERFSVRRKWASRLMLFVLMANFAFCLHWVPLWMMELSTGRIRIESPSLTSTAIKLGAYRLIWEYELLSQLPQEKELMKCVEAVSHVEALKYQSKCGSDRACFENIPIMSRKDILSKIEESQKTDVPIVSSICKTVDVAKLPPI